MNLQERALFAVLDDEQRRTNELRGEARWTCKHVLGTADVEITDVDLARRCVLITCDGLEFRANYRHVDGELTMVLEMNTGTASWMEVSDLPALGRWLRTQGR